MWYQWISTFNMWTCSSIGLACYYMICLDPGGYRAKFGLFTTIVYSWYIPFEEYGIGQTNRPSNCWRTAGIHQYSAVVSHSRHNLLAWFVHLPRHHWSALNLDQEEAVHKLYNSHQDFIKFFDYQRGYTCSRTNIQWTMFWYISR